MGRYHLVTTIRVSADRDDVWEVLMAPQHWPSWWRWLRRLQVLAAGDDGEGARYRATFRTALPYSLAIEAETVTARRPEMIVLQVSGELEGTGRWRLRPDDGGTAARYDWVVATTRWWMNALGPVARPVFVWNHEVLMRDFARGLSATTASRLRGVESRQIRPGHPGFGHLAQG